jgi:hypothetical protein
MGACRSTEWHDDLTATVIVPASPGFPEVRIACADGWVARIVEHILDSGNHRSVPDAERAARELNRLREMEDA